MDIKLRDDIIAVLTYFEDGLSDIQEGSQEEQPQLKEIRSILHRMKIYNDYVCCSSCGQITPNLDNKITIKLKSK